MFKVVLGILYDLVTDFEAFRCNGLGSIGQDPSCLNKGTPDEGRLIYSLDPPP